MHKLLRYYSQNRLKIWATILGIIFLIVLIQVLNSMVKKENQTKEAGETTDNNVVSYANESKSIISDDDVSEVYQDEFGRIITEFFDYCTSNQIEEAYNMLSSECKKALYQTESIFRQSYINEKFEGDKDFSFQSWISSGSLYIYQVKIFDNMLSTGKANDEYYEDYVTLVKEDDTYKLNVNSFIGKKDINEQFEENNIKISVVGAQTYMDYEIYEFNITNDTEKTIMLDSRQDTDTTYLVDSQENRYVALLNENTEDDLVIKPKETKNIKIRFNDTYRDGIRILGLRFDDIVLDYDSFLQNRYEYEKYSFVIEF